MHKQAAKLIKIINGILCQLTKPHSGCPFQAGREKPTHYFVQGLLQAQGHLKGGDVIQWVFQPIIRFQLQKLEFRREGVIEESLRE